MASGPVPQAAVDASGAPEAGMVRASAEAACACVASADRAAQDGEAEALMATLDEFMAAIREQESGGNYKVVNSIGAMGAYHIMPGNLPNWSKRTFGHSISEKEFLSHPDEQDAIARHIMAPNFKKYGPAGTAAIWYSGQPDPTKTYGDPPVYKYVQSVLSHLGSAGSVTGGKNVTPADDVSGSSVQTAGLQSVGYDAVIDLTPFGIPLNPFKLPGYLGGKLRDLGELTDGGVGGAIGGAMWDAVGPIVLAGLAVAIGGGAVLVGLYVTAKPAIDQTKDQVAQVATLAAL
jgi:hypothetical protein